MKCFFSSFKLKSGVELENELCSSRYCSATSVMLSTSVPWSVLHGRLLVQLSLKYMFAGLN